MEKKIRIYACVCRVLIFCMVFPPASSWAAIDQSKLDAAEEKFTTTVSNFNGAVDVTTVDKSGQATKMSVLITPGEKIKVPKNMPPKIGRIDWSDVAQYESMLMSVNAQDPYLRWFVENLWRDRINNALEIIEEKIKKEYPKDYENVNITVKEVTDVLGIDPPVGCLSGEPFVKIGNRFGGRVPNIDLKILERSLSKSKYAQEVIVEVGGTETRISPDASPYR